MAGSSRLSSEHPEMLSDTKPLIKLVDALYAHHLPAFYALQRAEVKKAPGRLWHTAFSSIYIAKNFRTAYHVDRGNLLGTMTAIMPLGKFTGGELVLPRWRIAFAYKPGDLLFFDPQQLHGNLPFKGKGFRQRSTWHVSEEEKRDEEKKQAKREVLMKCQCGWEETPSSEGQVPLRCMQCRKGPIANARYRGGEIHQERRNSHRSGENRDRRRGIVEGGGCLGGESPIPIHYLDSRPPGGISKGASPKSATLVSAPLAYFHACWGILTDLNPFSFGPCPG